MAPMAARDEESAPLLDPEDRYRGAGPSGDGPPAPSNGHGPQVVVVDSFDLPPNYSAVTGDTPSVTCRVCQTNIDISGKRDQHVVKCNFCGEATPIRNAPQGRKYVRCPCNCLLICKNTSQRIACPRPNCKRVISLAPSNPAPHNPSVPNVPGMCRVICAHCQDNFLFNTLNNSLARCPHCRKISSVGSDFARKRGFYFCLAGLIFLAFAIGATYGTSHAASGKVGLYLLCGGLYIGALLTFLRGFYYCTMKVSLMDGPGA